MLTDLPLARHPRSEGEAEAARDLEPVHTGMRSLLGRAEDLFGGVPTGWIPQRTALCQASGLAFAMLGSIPHRLAAISDRIAEDVVLHSFPVDLDADESLPGLRTATARILWSGRPLLASLAIADAFEMRAGRSPGAGLPPEIAGLDAAGWVERVRDEALAIHDDPLAWEVEPPLPAGRARR